MKIIVIDSGIDSSHAVFNECNISGFSYINGIMSDCYYDTSGHGTAVASIIISRLKKIDLLCIRIFDTGELAKESDLISVLNYIEIHEEPTVINLSAGVIQPSNPDALYNACAKLAKKGFVLVSGFDNYGAISYPAAFDCVIGVEADQACRHDDEFIFNENSVVNISAKGISQTVLWTNHSRRHVAGSSFAVPFVTVAIYKAMQNGIILFDNLIDYLKKCSTTRRIFRTTQSPQLFETKKYTRAVAFPFNKEMHALIRHNDMLNIELGEVYNFKYLGNIGKSTTALLNTSVDYTIKNIRDICWEDDFDVFILGHCDQVPQLIGFDIQKEIIHNCFAYRKNLFAFDGKYVTPDIIAAFKDAGLTAYVPGISEYCIPYSNMNRLYVANTPIIAILGTSSKQGKFTLQLELRKGFRARGYTVGQLGTEPTSELFGFDQVFPIGYNSDQSVSGGAAIAVVNQQVKLIEEKKYDLIVVGAQSGSVPYQIRNVLNIPYNTYEFLLGTNPDIVLLCINYDDEEELIIRTIKYIEGLVDTRVVAAIMFPMKKRFTWSGLHVESDRISQDELLTKCRHFSELLGINVYINGLDLHMDNLVSHCINALS